MTDDTAEFTPPGSPFYHYNASFDAIPLIRKHAVADLKGTDGFLTNFQGVLTDVKFFPSHLASRSGTVEAIPIPANWHADIAEWAAAFRAVEMSRGTFTMVELGCGWGCWMNNAGVAARRLGRAVSLIGIEGDEGHCDFAREACQTNGFEAKQVKVHRGIAAATSGVALFPRQSVAGASWGLEPIFNATEQQRRKCVQAGTHDELPMIALADVMKPHGRIDLLHVDIQGGEADLIAQTLPLLSAKVAFIVIGTHSRQIEGRLFDSLGQAGWHLDMERPALLNVFGDKPVVTVDGVQGWRNPKLLPSNTG